MSPSEKPGDRVEYLALLEVLQAYGDCDACFPGAPLSVKAEVLTW